ncbi:MAG: hypothetical protein GY724_12630 [Actinomycetia bacterium]|nr:hypothetical protein [Actinomycetes bacterium]
MADTQLDPTPDYDRSSQDVGNVLSMEHVNLAVTDRDVADRFYISGLGFTHDPYIDLGIFGTTWANLGSQQMHLMLTDRAQRFRGRIGLVVPDPQAVIKRLDQLLNRVPTVAETQLAHTLVDDDLVVTGPWGNQFRIHGPNEIAGFTIGMPYVEVDVEVGRAPAIATFYQTILGCPTRLEDDSTAVVAVGLHQELRFCETDAPIIDFDGHHIAVYLNNFSGPYDQLKSRDLITIETDENEYRFTDIIDLDSGEVCTKLEHEVRSMYHPMFGRALVNRDVRQGLGRRYRKGLDTEPGLHQGGVG